MICPSSHSPWETQLGLELRISDCNTLESVHSTISQLIPINIYELNVVQSQPCWGKAVFLASLSQISVVSLSWLFMPHLPSLGQLKLHLCLTDFFQITHPDREWNRLRCQLLKPQGPTFFFSPNTGKPAQIPLCLETFGQFLINVTFHKSIFIYFFNFQNQHTNH